MIKLYKTSIGVMSELYYTRLKSREFIYRAHLKTTTVYQSDVQSISIRTAIKKAIYPIKSYVRQAIKNSRINTLHAENSPCLNQSPRRRNVTMLPAWT